MKGKIFSFDVASDTGLITSEDADRYEFFLDAWKSVDAPLKGTPIEFYFGEDGSITEIYRVVPVAPEPPEPPAPSEKPTGSVAPGEKKAPQIVYRRMQGGKSRLVAAALAIFLGGLGAHKFYTGDPVSGGIRLAVFLLGLLMMFIPTVVIAGIAVIEGVIYLFTSTENFDRTYLQGRRAWF